MIENHFFDGASMKLKFRSGSLSPRLIALLPLLVLAYQPSLAQSNANAGAAATPYRVVDGDKVDSTTFNGWKTWRAMACERCHGANQEGLVGPSLINSLKVLSKEEFVETITNGRPDKGMPNFGGVESAVSNLGGLYAYLKGRSDGAIKPGRVQKAEEK